MNTKQLVKKYKKHYESLTGDKLDFRSVVYNFNQYALHPMGNVADSDVVALYSWANAFVKENEDKLRGFQGFQYNVQMTMNQLESMKFKDLVKNVCERIAVHFE